MRGRNIHWIYFIFTLTPRGWAAYAAPVPALQVLGELLLAHVLLAHVVHPPGVTVGALYMWAPAGWSLGCSSPDNQSGKKINSLHIPPPYDPSKWIPKGILIWSTGRPPPRLVFFTWSCILIQGVFFDWSPQNCVFDQFLWCNMRFMSQPRALGWLINHFLHHKIC